MLFEWLALGAGIALADPSAPSEPSDLIVHNAIIWTADPQRDPGGERAARPEPTMLAVRDGRFIDIGDDSDLARWVGPDTRVIDANGRRILPGLIDTHVHLASAADDVQHLQLRAARSREHLLRMVRDHAATLESDDWLIGVRWTAESWPDQRPPNADEIDEAAGGRRAMLMRMDGHMLLASRSALDYAGIIRDGPADPPGGRIGRAPDGTPNGALYEQAMSLLRSRLPAESGGDLLQRFRRALAECNRVGVTQVGAIEPRSVIDEVLIPLDRAEALTVRIAATVRPAGDRPRQWNEALEWAAAHRTPSPLIRVLGFKGVMDGTLGSRTAWMTEPYLDNSGDPSNAGFPLALAGSGQLRQWILRGAEMGLQPAVHAIGEQANHVVLDWYAEIPGEQRTALRPRVEHAQHLLPQDVLRFETLGVVASMQPLHKADDGRYAAQRLGLERLRTSYAYRDLIDSGAMLAFGSDWPVVSINPWEGIHAAVSAKTLDDRTFLPEQSVTVEEALVAYTREAARCLLCEDETGMIRPGFAADFIMVDRDVLNISHEEIPETEVQLTVVGGRIVHEIRTEADSKNLENMD